MEYFCYHSFLYMKEIITIFLLINLSTNCFSQQGNAYYNFTPEDDDIFYPSDFVSGWTINVSGKKEFYSLKLRVKDQRVIIQKDGKTIKPDRMVLGENKAIYLLDYKTGNHQNKHKLQLENYQYAIEKMGYKVDRKTLVYIGEKIEIVNLF